jgi:LCP family protein required for cell wall assembly
MPKLFEQTRRNWERRYRLDHHRRQYRSRVLGRAPLPERRPRLAYLFAILPVIAIIGLLISAPVLAGVNDALVNITDPQVPAASLPPCEIVEQGTPPAQGASTETCTPPAVVDDLPPWNGKDRINILLVGVDRREADEIPRTDTIIIVTIDPQSKTAGMMSLPRDLLVTIPGGYGKDKLNAAFVYGERDKRVGGGVGLLRRTIQENFYVQISHYGTIDFRGFERVVDEFGGVTVDPPYPLLDNEYPTETLGYTTLYFPAGLQHLSGAAALRYSRTRHPDNDFGRARRQQEVILALRDQAVGQGLITNLNLVTKFFPLLNILGDSVRTDLNREQIGALANLGLSIPRDSIKRYSLYDLIQDYEDENGILYVVPSDWAKARARLREMIPNAPQVLPTPTPDLGVKIGVQNGTVRDRFAARTVDRLKAAGFARAVVDETQPVGELPFEQTTIYVYTGKGDAAALVAKSLGLTDPDIREATGTAPNGVDVLVVLGNDVPDVSAPRATPTPTRRP